MLTKGGEARRGGADVVLGRWGYSAVLHAPPWGGGTGAAALVPTDQARFTEKAADLRGRRPGLGIVGGVRRFSAFRVPKRACRDFASRALHDSRPTPRTGRLGMREYEGADDPTRRIDTSLLIPATVRRPSTAVFTVFLLCILLVV